MVALVVTATFLVTSATTIALILGDPELLTLLAILGLAITVVGVAALTTDTHYHRSQLTHL